MATNQNDEQLATSMGLPADAPLPAIDAYLKSLQTNKGVSKGNAGVSDIKRKAEGAIMGYMKSKELTFLQIRERYLILKSEAKIEGWSDELVLKAFVAFHRRNLNQGAAIEQVAVNFVEFCKSVRKSSGEVKESLTLSKKRPLSATLSMLSSMNGIL
jgi:hypothetical protein